MADKDKGKGKDQDQPKKKRATNGELAKRINTVFQLICDGWDDQALVPFISKEWDLGHRQARNYIYKARARLAEITDECMVSALGQAIAARRELRRKSQDPEFKLRILQDEAKLLGLYTERTQVDIKGSPLITVDF